MEKRDVLWKAIIEDFFPSFLDYFYPKYVRLIDKGKGFEFLDKELQRISPKSKGNQRFVDKLVKVYLKDGDAIWILIHIEVQGYYDENFEERMYIYQYRIFDKYKVKTAALVILTDDKPNFLPKKYRSRIFDTIIDYRFSAYKLSDRKESDFQNSNNPFSIIMETAWWGLKKNKLTQRQLFSKKINLYRRLQNQGFSNEQIHNLLTFIKYYIPFEKPELNLKFEEEIDKYSKNKENMGIQEALLNFHEEKGIEKGMEKGIEKGTEIGMEKSIQIIDFLREGKSVEGIAKELKVPIAIIEKLQSKIK